MDVLSFCYHSGKHALKRLFVRDSNSEDSILQHVMLGLIEEVRTLMLNGSEDAPVMDPFELPHLNIELNDDGRSHLVLENFETKNLSTFVVNELTYVVISHRLHFYRIEVDCHIPVLEINAEKYDLDITTPAGLRLYGNGWFKLKLNEPRVTAKINFSIDDLNTLTVQNTDVVVKLESLEPQITGLYDNLIVNDTVELNLEILVPQILRIFQNNITEMINKAIKEYGNVALMYGDTFVSQSTIQALKGLELLPS